MTTITVPPQDTLDHYPYNSETISLYGGNFPVMPSLLRFSPYIMNVNLRNNRISELPSIWADTIEILDLCNNEIQIVLSLPDNLKWFSCSNNQITSICPLPKKTCFLQCDNNALEEIPILPESIVYVYAYHNRIRALSKFPDNLNVLDCSHNCITQIDIPLPAGLRSLYLDKNPITMVPRLPSRIALVSLNDEIMDLVRRVPDHIVSTIGGKINHAHDAVMAFKTAYYLAKYRRPLRDALWRIRERHAMEDMHPSVIRRMLDKGIELDDIYMTLVSDA